MTHQRQLQTSRQASCEGKRQFVSYSAALRVLRASAEPLNIYRCRFCSHFHLGHSEGVMPQRKPPIEPDEDWTAEI